MPRDSGNPDGSGEESDPGTRGPTPHRVVPPGATHHRQDRPPVRWRRGAAAAGALAGVLGLGLGGAALSSDDQPDDAGFSRANGTSARHITARPARLPMTDAQIVALLERPPDVGPLADPRACLDALGASRILGAAPVSQAGPPAVLLVLPGADPSSLVAVVVAPDCPASGSAPLSRTVLARP